MARYWQPATVVSADGERVQLRFDQLSQCQRCLRGEGCGAGVFSQLFSQRSTTLQLPSNESWQVGQQVRVGLAPQRLVSGSLLLYGWPLIGFLGGAILGGQLDLPLVSPDLAALLAGMAAAFLIAGYSWLRTQRLGTSDKTDDINHQLDPKIEKIEAIEERSARDACWS